MPPARLHSDALDGVAASPMTNELLAWDTSNAIAAKLTHPTVPAVDPI